MATLATASAMATTCFTLLAGAGLRRRIGRLPTSVGGGRGGGQVQQARGARAERAARAGYFRMSARQNGHQRWWREHRAATGCARANDANRQAGGGTSMQQQSEHVAAEGAHGPEQQWPVAAARMRVAGWTREGWSEQKQGRGREKRDMHAREQKQGCIHEEAADKIDEEGKGEEHTFDEGSTMGRVGVTLVE
ncbi:unnamed protein product [Miscanthus lutarioriparius]|uniref:Uncharacterized protein n=1 Tax=Miscanthus lutarioriparius TaxID=422564 RepID=A0A811QJ02_9POAL|nr:unnamed protein product [Miscanthus lutarioriparius]